MNQKFLKATGTTLEKYPYSLRDFKADHPGVSPPNDMAALTEFDVHPVDEVTRPAPANPLTHRVVEVDPVESGGTWTQTWVEQALSAEIIAAVALQTETDEVRDAIKSNPWLVTFANMTVSDVEAWVAANVTNLAEAKDLLEKLAIVCLLLVKQNKSQ